METNFYKRETDFKTSQISRAIFCYYAPMWVRLSIIFL